MRQAVFCQCFGLLGQALFTSNVVLLYLLALGADEAKTLFYVVLPNILLALLGAPLAHVADRVGIKRMGNIGILVNTTGIILLAAAGSLASPLGREICSAAGIIVYGIGYAAFASVWFSLLQPIIPEAVRGRFFGLLRLSWQGVSFGAAALIAYLLSLWNELAMFQVIIAATAGLILARGVFYRAIPEMVSPPRERTGMMTALVQLGGQREYAAFGSYIFLLTLFTFICPSLFALVEKTALNLSQSTVVLLANAGMVGAIMGFWLGGLAVDRFGTKYVFLACHLAYGLVLGFFVLRGLFPQAALMAVLGTAHLLFGMIMSASEIAITSESMALSPARHHTLALALLISARHASMFMSGFLSSGALKAGFLMKEWRWRALVLCDVDAIIAACAVMVVILVATLGLVPSIFRKTDLGAV